MAPYETKYSWKKRLRLQELGVRLPGLSFCSCLHMGRGRVQPCRKKKRRWIRSLKPYCPMPFIISCMLTGVPVMWLFAPVISLVSVTVFLSALVIFTNCQGETLSLIQ